MVSNPLISYEIPRHKACQEMNKVTDKPGMAATEVGGSESLDDWMGESLQRWRDWKNPWKTFSTPWSSLVWMSRTGGLWWTMVDYGGLVWTAILHFLSIPSSWTTNLCATVRHLMVSGITNGGTQHPSILPIFSAHMRPLYPTSGWWIIPIMYPLVWLTYTACFWTHKCCSHFQVILLYFKFYWLCTHYMTTIHVT